MYLAFGNITCDCCGTEVSNLDFVVVKGKEYIQHFCNEGCLKNFLINKTKEDGGTDTKI
jgi:YHS domain-containing protein